MNAMPQYEPLDDVRYPESDGQPMAETDLHWRATVDLALMLKARYRDIDGVYVASDNFVYYREGDPSGVFSPDVYVVFGVESKPRRTYKVWEEGVTPTVVFEITSRSTSLEVEGNKKVLCARLGVREYWLFDPEGDALSPALQGYRLPEDAELTPYEPVEPEDDGSLVSEALGLVLRNDGGRLDLRDVETGERLLPPDELESARVAAEREVIQLRAEVAALHSKGL